MYGFDARVIVIIAVLLLGLWGCGTSNYVEDVTEPSPVRVKSPERGPVYRVKSGDTLYSIAFAVGRDWRDLAAANGIATPYTIFPGQPISLGGAPGTANMTGAQSAILETPEPGQAALEPESKPTAPRVQAQQEMPLPTPQSAPAPIQQVLTDRFEVVPTPVIPPPSDAQPAVAQSTVSQKIPSPVSKPGVWQWPAGGVLMLGYSTGAQPHKGIDIGGQAGDPVFAANSGTVVYAGNGVRGYGNLLILKHDPTYLSAYAHNSRLLAKEGDVIEGGQKIAEIGDSGTDRVKLHFEVRRNGSPVDPTTVLPKR